MDILHQILTKNRLMFISLAEIIVYTILLSLIIYHFIIYLGRKKFKEGKYYLYFSYYFSGLLMYIFSDTFTYYLTLSKFFTKRLTTFFIALSFLIMYKSIILIMNSSLELNLKTKKLVNKVFNYYALFNLVWILPALIMIKNNFRIFWGFNFTFASFLCVIYFSYLIRNNRKIESSIKTIAWLPLCYIVYIIFYRAIWMFFPKAPTLPFWVMNDSLKIVVAFVFAYALAKKTNKDFFDLQELKENLEQKVIEKTRELRESKKKIEESHVQRTNYFVNLAHETKTPLTLISNFLDRYIKTSGPSKELNIVKENFDKLKNEMLRFLDVEKYEKGLVKYDNIQVINLSYSIKQKIPLYKEHALQHKIKLSYDIEGSVNIKGDQAAFDGIINNLFENAVKYSDEGSSVKILLNKTGSEALLTVSDTGLGIEEEKLKNIFQPYYQVSRTKLNRQGLGMGLFIVKNIVELLNGSIDVKSTINKGTEILVRLPLTTAEPSNKQHADTGNIILPNDTPVKIKEVTYLAERKNIMIVEDNKDMCNYLAEELNETYNIFVAENGLDALSKLKTTPKIDIILSDVMMDHMDGTSFFKSLAHNDNYSNIPFIFLTAKSDNDEKLDMLTKGATDYLYKPFSIDELKAKIHSVLVNVNNQRTNVIKDTLKMIQSQMLNWNQSENNKWGTFEINKNGHELTERQIEIIKLVEQGLEYKQIANQLNISVKTVHRHIQNLYEKFGVHSKIELMKVLFD